MKCVRYFLFLFCSLLIGFGYQEIISRHMNWAKRHTEIAIDRRKTPQIVTGLDLAMPFLAPCDRFEMRFSIIFATRKRRKKHTQTRTRNILRLDTLNYIFIIFANTSVGAITSADEPISRHCSGTNNITLFLFIPVSLFANVTNSLQFR